MYSVVIPVYNNAEFVPLLVAEFAKIDRQVRERYGMPVEFVFVVDGSPDDSHERLAAELPRAPFRSRLILLSRNFGSFAAIRAGLGVAEGDNFGVIAADLQEPPELLIAFLEKLAVDRYDLVVGVREERDDPWFDRAAARVFWRLYRWLVVREIPRSGVDVFACNRRFRDQLLLLEESHSSLVGLIFWLGFRRSEVSYARRRRLHGVSGWTFRRKLKYLLDSVFSFTDLPVRVLTLLGAFGTGVALLFAMLIVVLRLIGDIPVPGYAATIITIMFFGALNTFGLGLVGSYAWRAYENTKRRPLSVLQSTAQFGGSGEAADGVAKGRSLPT